MWCTFEAIDVTNDLKTDPQWGRVHKADGAWHTVCGFPLQGEPAVSPNTTSGLRPCTDGRLPSSNPIVVQLRVR